MKKIIFITFVLVSFALSNMFWFLAYNTQEDIIKTLNEGNAVAQALLDSCLGGQNEKPKVQTAL